MIKKICPVCDNCIGAMNYCKTCHQFVFHPERREMRYYLNESHPAEESFCEYHNDSDYVGASYERSADMSERKSDSRTEVRTGRSGSGSSTGSRTGSGTGGKMRKADYLAKKAAMASAGLRGFDRTAVWEELDRQLEKRTGKNQEAGQKRRSGKGISMRSDQKDAKANNPAMRLIVIILIYLFFSMIANFSR